MDNKLSQKLSREISLFPATMMVVAVVIGSGVFFKPSSVFGGINAPGLGIVAWILGGIITLAGALSIAELGTAMPQTGGLMVYLNRLFGEKLGFLFGWSQVLIYFPAMDAALAVAFASQCTAFWPLTDVQQKLVSVGMLVVLGLINLLPTKVGAKFASVVTIAKLIPIAVIIVAGLTLGQAHTFTPMVSSGTTASGFGAAMLGVLFAYEGWIAVCNLGGEIQNPAKNFPKAILFGLLIITVVYLGVNIAVLNTMSLDAILASKKVVSDAAEILLGTAGARLIAIGILVSIFGCLSPFILAGGRLPYSMAMEGNFIFRSFFSKLNGNGSPANAIFIQIVLAALYILTGTFDTLTNLLVFVTWGFISVGIAGVFVMRKKHSELVKEDGYRVPLFPVVPIIGIIGALYICFNTIVTTTGFAIFGVLVTLIGLPVYSLIQKRNANTQ
ncbi:APC family permease [Sporomusa aerivorans]|uniref:APC family permease n=1 Tax=Sporomusa aerivorans TaxID=204936 RepID=UPI00352BC8E8